MNAYDSSVLVAALAKPENFHVESLSRLTREPFAVYTHALVETFNTLTSGKVKPRPSASMASMIIKSNIMRRARILRLDEPQVIQAFDEAESRGVRGGAIFDYLHLVAARHHGMERLYTLNMRHFQAFWRPGDPEVVHP